jgi:hypothetical protein
MPCGAQLQQVCISGEKFGLVGWAREARRPAPAGAIAPALVLALAYGVPQNAVSLPLLKRVVRLRRKWVNFGI